MSNSASVRSPAFPSIAMSDRNRSVMTAPVLPASSVRNASATSRALGASNDGCPAVRARKMASARASAFEKVTRAGSP